MVDERAVPESSRSWVDTEPYARSWVDVVQDALERLPWPPWLSYLGLWLALAGTETAIKWSTGAYPVGTVFPYHTVRQLGIIDALYRTATSFDLFHVRPLYAFSAMVARTAMGLFAILFAWIVVYPRGVDASVTRLLAGTETTLLVLVFATFLAPLWGAHQRLAAERSRRLEEIRGRLRIVMDELADSVARRDYAAVDGITKAMTGVSTELAMVERASTWPWPAATLRGFLTAVLLPLLVWSLQQVLARSLLG